MSGPLEDWPTYPEVSRILLVSVKRLQNLVSAHKLERRHRWIGRGRQRRRIARLSPATVRTLAQLTKNSYLVAHLDFPGSTTSHPETSQK